jgi:D-glycero-alpha-D-manno-heptose-7-phosphate kinase
LLNALRAFQGYMSSARWLATEAMRIEQEVIRETVGAQDQVWASHGGTSLITFHPDGRFDITPVIMSAERRTHLESHLLLFFTGFARTADTIASQQIPNLKRRENQIHAMVQMAREASAILQNPAARVRDLGTMLGDAWRLKKELADCISTPAVDQIYQAAVGAGALGGKLLGAGGGGFVLIFAEPSSHGRIREALRGLTEVSFQTGSPGSTIVIYEPDGLEQTRRAPETRPAEQKAAANR